MSVDSGGGGAGLIAGNPAAGPFFSKVQGNNDAPPRLVVLSDAREI